MPQVIGNHLTGNLARDEKLLRTQVVDVRRVLKTNEDVIFFVDRGHTNWTRYKFWGFGGEATKVLGEPQ